MVRIIWTELATIELKKIYEFIAQDSKLYAKRQVLKIKNKSKILKSSKYIGKVVEEIGIPIVREIVEGNYKIIYKIKNENEIAILTIHQSARDLTKREIEST
ncbi:MAG: type II toxin-antitoxin system RelE/ParE family toxin [Saprospiraceae bacterium]|nr:type II toxin-antitoxin system RelE/ParE family toxin [Candidatus Defluviibacterium haderslevense]